MLYSLPSKATAGGGSDRPLCAFFTWTIPHQRLRPSPTGNRHHQHHHQSKCQPGRQHQPCPSSSGQPGLNMVQAESRSKK